LEDLEEEEDEEEDERYRKNQKRVAKKEKIKERERKENSEGINLLSKFTFWVLIVSIVVIILGNIILWNVFKFNLPLEVYTICSIIINLEGFYLDLEWFLVVIFPNSLDIFNNNPMVQFRFVLSQTLM